MPFPPSTIAADKANNTAIVDDHPAHHNALATAVNDITDEIQTWTVDRDADGSDVADLGRVGVATGAILTPSSNVAYDVSIADRADGHPSDPSTFPGEYITDGSLRFSVNVDESRSWATTDPGVMSGNTVTIIGATSVGVNVSTFAGSGDLYVESFSGFSTPVWVETEGGICKVSFTGTSSSGGNHFTGCTLVEGNGGLMFTGGKVMNLGAVGAHGPGVIHINPDRVSLGASRTANSMYGLFMRGGYGWTTGATVRNFYGIHLAATPEGTATFDNAYGLYIESRPAAAVGRSVLLMLSGSDIEGGSTTTQVGLKIAGLGNTDSTNVYPIQVDDDGHSYINGSLAVGRRSNNATGTLFEVDANDIEYTATGVDHISASLGVSTLLGGQTKFASTATGCTFTGVLIDHQIEHDATLSTWTDLKIKGNSNQSNSAANVTTHYGIDLDLRVGRSSGTTTDDYGIRLIQSPRNTVTTLHGIHIAPSDTTAGSGVQAFRGITVDADGLNSQGTTNAYGLKIKMTTATIDLGGSMCIQAGDLPSQHQGKFGIGAAAINTIPSARLDVTEATIGNEVMRLTSTATNDDVMERVYQGRVATTQGTATTIITIAIPSSTTVGIAVTVVCRRTGGSAGSAEDGGFFLRTACFKNVGGAATEIGADGGVSTQESQAAYDVTISASGGNALVQVTGIANTNLTWHATARVYPVSS